MRVGVNDNIGKKDIVRKRSLYGDKTRSINIMRHITKKANVNSDD
jgi:hypothetical protein